MPERAIEPLNDSLIAGRDWIRRALTAEMNYRPDHDDWIERERMAVTVAANEYAQAKGLHTITVDEVERVESLAVGHYDYTNKLALYVSELIHGEREVRP